MGQNNHNNTSDTNVDDSDTAAEFNQIYNNLVAKIRSRVNRPELPAIGKREEPRGDAPKPETGEREGVGDMIAVLRRTLRAGQQEEDRKCQKDFGAVMNKKQKVNRKKNCNMLYQSLVEVRRNIEAMEKKTQPRLRKML